MLLTNQLINQKTTWLIRFTCLFWLASKIISYKLWLSERLFPLVPPTDFLQVPSLVHWALFVLSIIVLVGLLIFSNNKKFLVAVIVIEVISCLFDQNRWQPWEYQYILTLLIVVINKKDEKNIVFLVCFMLASIYFYSGVGKINPVFLQSIWYNLLLSKTFGFSYAIAHQTLIYYSGYLLGLIEIALGIGLLFKRTQKLAALFLIIMHFIILGIFGPFGLNYDHVIWPWNLAMLAYLFFFIYRNPDFEISFSSLKLKWNLPIVILLGIMPFFSLFGKWDFFLSSSLFSSRPTDMYICIKKNAQNPLYKYCDKTQSPCDTGSCMINVRNWAFDEMLAPAYPQRRVYENIKIQLQNRYPDLQATYYIYTYKNGKKVRDELK